ncbi:MAG: hypothetical protein H0V45_12535 [Actinobacteria bacterium]|nr:hypothetical protein [Actinomycetota bacterium]
MKRLLASLCLAAGLLAVAAPASAATAWKGVVVAKDAKRGTVVTASANGVVRTARSPKARTLRIGERLAVTGTQLADGTFAAASVRASGRAKTARVKAVVVRYQKTQKRLLVSAGGSTFALARPAAVRTLASVSESSPQPGDQIEATVNVSTPTPQATAITTVGRLGTLEVEGILTKIGDGSAELVVARAGYVTFALPAGFVLPAGLHVFDEVKAIVAIGTDGKLTLLALQSDAAADRDDEGVDFHDDDGELEAKGSITALSDTSVSISPGVSASPITCSLLKPLKGFKLGDLVELECAAGPTGGLVLKDIEHDDDDEDADRDDDDDDEDEDEDDD